MEWTAAGVIAIAVVLVVRGWRRHHQKWSLTFHITYDDTSTPESGRAKAPDPTSEDDEPGA